MMCMDVRRAMLAMQAAELLRHSTPEVIDTFIGTRLAGTGAGWGSTFGTVGIGAGKAAGSASAARIVERAHVGRRG